MSLEKIRLLNPNVEVRVIEEEWRQVDFEAYNIVCMGGSNFQSVVEASGKARELGKYFLACDVFGFYGFLFIDIGDSFDIS